MTRATMTRSTGASAYPIPADVLTEKARALAVELGGWPSQRRVMRTCRVGAPRADAALAALRAAGFDPTTTRAPAAPTAPTAPTGPAAKPALTVVGAEHNDAGHDVEPAGRTGGRSIESDQSRPTTGDTQVNPAAGTPVDAPTEAAVDAAVAAGPAPAVLPAQAPADAATTVATGVGDAAPGRVRVPRWPLLLIGAGAFVAIWGGWVGLGELAGFGPIRLLPGIADGFVINSAITLPIGVEAYAAFALRAWLAPAAGISRTARRFACCSALGALALGAAGQIAYHLMVAAGLTQAPWQITAFVSCLPVVVLGCGAALTHLIHRPEDD